MQIDPDYMPVYAATGTMIHLVPKFCTRVDSVIGPRYRAQALCASDRDHMWRMWTKATSKEMKTMVACRHCFQVGGRLAPVMPEVTEVLNFQDGVVDMESSRMNILALKITLKRARNNNA